jgi:signal transduction histidine kinase
VGFIERVLENLIDNALQYTPQGGVVSVSLTPSRQGVTVEVTDTGYGIPATELPHIFERFYQVSRTAKEKVGAGLGLTISQRMLELHGSQLQVASEVDVGTTFSFSLPTA